MVPEYSRPHDIQALAARLAELGYYPVPIPAGHKGPVTEGWQNLRLTADQAPDHFTNQMLVGVLHVNVLAIDIDVYDEELSRTICAEAARRWPSALERIGQYPKSAFFLRVEEPAFKVRATRKREKIAHDGAIVTAQVDVRSATRQIVAYGKHPETGKPYRWPRGELWATPRADLPLAEQADVERFRDWCEDQIAKWAGEADPKVIDLGLYPPRIASDERPSEEAFRAALQHVPANVGYDDWLSGLMAIHDYYSGSLTGLDVAKAWSAAYPAYDPREVETKWRSFEVGKGTTYRTVFHLAKLHGADMTAIARIDRPQAAPLQIQTENDAASATPEPVRAKPDLEWFDDIEAALADTYAIKGVIAVGAMSVIYGPSNSGKTFFALDMAFHIAIGATWRGRRVQQCAVLYLAAEGGRGIANRIVALKREYGVCDVPFALRRAGMDLLQNEADLQKVYDLAKEVMAKAPELPLVIVVDTLSRVMAGGDENNAADMTALIRNIDMIREATGGHIMLVHHTGKDTARGARGHSSLRAATDTEIEVQVTDDNGELMRAAQVTKQRDYQGGETFAFALKSISLGYDQDGDEVTSCVVVCQDADEYQSAARAKKGLGGNQKIIAETFDQMLAEGLAKPNPGGVGLPDAGRFWCVPIDDLRKHCLGKFAGSNGRDAWRTAWQGVSEKRGLFCAAAGLAWRVDRLTRGKG